MNRFNRFRAHSLLCNGVVSAVIVKKIQLQTNYIT